MSVRRQVVADVLARPLDGLVVADDQVINSSTDVERWNLARSELQALTRYGLPVIEECDIIPNIQQGILPELDAQGRNFYLLGLFADHEIGVLAGEGEVWGIPLDRTLPDSFINSSVARFVETSWRWYWVWKEVKALRYDIEQYDLLEDFLDFAVRTDARVDSVEPSLWKGLIQSW
ncbi:SUKH-4 family immunity protein [Streptomyces sp. NPDC048405]|uniref:SUKH-4 family immunity protein n=1 Tax=unclassified Streptomyces TaxID=2593676 RepID=UPI003720370B|nr:SUKH-4 family immunity protein [Streptomyces sp. NBC_01124]WSU05884.1 SUKH-4 family immunity protein [Streptomyces sp. NBC_01124]